MLPRSTSAPRPKFFATPAAFRAWLEQNHAARTELWVGYYKKASGRGGMVYREALDEALCYGWIDGLVKSIDAGRYMQRFTPRRLGSIWSNINVAHVARLSAAGRMQPAGLAAFAARQASKTGIYAFEQRPEKFPATLEKIFRANRIAWIFWQTQPPGYRRTAIWWVISAKQEATRERRLARLISFCSAGKRLDAG